MFNAIEYLTNVAKKNRLVRNNGFHIGECSGLEAIEPLLDNYQNKKRFVLIDDTVDGSLVSNGTGFFNRRIFTVAIISRYKYNDMADRMENLNICREIFRQFMSRFIIDKRILKNKSYSLTYMRTEFIQYREMQTFTFDGATGVVFMLPIDEPTNLQYNNDEWDL